jgi:hypothetical protein
LGEVPDPGRPDGPGAPVDEDELPVGIDADALFADDDAVDGDPAVGDQLLAVAAGADAAGGQVFLKPEAGRPARESRSVRIGHGLSPEDREPRRPALRRPAWS